MNRRPTDTRAALESALNVANDKAAALDAAIIAALDNPCPANDDALDAAFREAREAAVILRAAVTTDRSARYTRRTVCPDS